MVHGRCDNARVARLTSGPMVRTLAGTRARLRLMDCEDVKLLLRHYRCPLEELDYAMWSSRRNRRRPRAGPAQLYIIGPQRALFEEMQA